jgi:hypothetical protein
LQNAIDFGGLNRKQNEFTLLKCGRVFFPLAVCACLQIKIKIKIKIKQHYELFKRKIHQRSIEPLFKEVLGLGKGLKWT